MLHIEKGIGDDMRGLFSLMGSISRVIQASPWKVLNMRHYSIIAVNVGPLVPCEKRQQQQKKQQFI